MSSVPTDFGLKARCAQKKQSLQQVERSGVSPAEEIGYTPAVIRLLIIVTTLVLTSGCRPEPVFPVRVDAPFRPAHTDHLRLVLIGDTGSVNEHMRALRVAVMAERKDAVLVLGDLVYPLAPECKDGRLTPAVTAELDAKVGGLLRGLGSPVLLMLGNHDTDWGRAHTAREACLLNYAAGEPDLVFPAASYAVDYGVALLTVFNTNQLNAKDGRAARQAFEGHRGWKIGMGHHVLKTYRDKVGETIVANWLKRERLKPDLWFNGHAHLLQLGVYDGIVGVTSGTAAYPRKKPGCPGKCGPGEAFGSSAVGYAVVDLTADVVDITFKDVKGAVLFRQHYDKRDLRGAAGQAK